MLRPLAALTALAAPLLIGTAWSADWNSGSQQRDSARCQAGNVDACYDAIRWNPRDAALMVGLGDGLARAGRSADALRSYRRAAAMSPNVPGLSAKINLIESRINAKRMPKSTNATVAGNRPAAKYSNAAPESESH